MYFLEVWPILCIEMHLNKKIVFLLFLIQIQFASSQVVNIENKRIYDDTSGASGSIDASFSAMKTKDLLVNIFFRPRIQYKTIKHYYLIITDLMYSRGGDRVYSNSGLVHFQYAYRLKGPLKWENYFQTQYNHLLNQQSKIIIGSGLRLKCYDSKGYKFFTGISAFIEREELINSQIIQNDARLSNYISWYFDPKKHYFFSGVLYLQPSFQDFSDLRIMGQYSLNFHFTKRTDFKVEFTHFYDSRPSLGVVKSTFNSSFGIRMKLGEK